MSCELDIENSEALVDWLRSSARIGARETPTIRTLAGGVSNRTVWVGRPSGEAWVLKQALAKLRVQVDWFSSPERIHREAAGLRWLVRLAPGGSITPFVFEDFEHHVLAMQAVPEPHENWKSMLLAGRLDLAHADAFGRLLGAIHRRAFEERDAVAGEFEDRSYFESLRLEPYYAYTATQVTEAAAFLAALIDETRATRLTLVHGDYSPKNVLVHRGRLVLLDHEVIHFGDPAFDLGFSLTHFLSKGHHLRDRRDDFFEAALRCWRAYRAEIGDIEWAAPVEARAVRHTLACLLARVAGRSPLEYLDETERKRQRAAVVASMAEPPPTLTRAIAEFSQRIRTQDENP